MSPLPASTPGDRGRDLSSFRAFGRLRSSSLARSDREGSRRTHPPDKEAHERRPTDPPALAEIDLRVYIRQLVGNDDDARDLAQDAYARALHALGRGLQPIDQRAWLFRTARNVAIDHLRRRRFLRLFVRIDAVAEPGAAEDRTDSIAVWSAVESLPMSEREAIVLRYRWDLTSAEIGQVLERSEGAVRALLSRAVARLRRDLGEPT